MGQSFMQGGAGFGTQVQFTRVVFIGQGLVHGSCGVGGMGGGGGAGKRSSGTQVQLTGMEPRRQTTWQKSGWASGETKVV
jgi:hypothetical protein